MNGRAAPRLASAAAHLTAGGGVDAAVETAAETLEIRDATPAELKAARIPQYVFGYGNPLEPAPAEGEDDDDGWPSDEVLGDWTLLAGFSSTTGAAVAQLVASPAEMVPSSTGAAVVPFAAVTGVGTLPEYRRRGLLRGFMTRLFADMRERGQPLAALWATQAAIYQRYQYSCVTTNTTYSVDTVDIRFTDGDGGSCEVTRMPLLEAQPELRSLYESYTEGRPCAMTWDARAAEWEDGVGPTVNDGPSPMGPKASPHVAIARDASGTVRGYVVFRTGWGSPGRDQSRDHPTRGQVLTIGELVWVDVDAYRSLWSFIARHDLVMPLPVSPPLRPMSSD